MHLAISTRLIAQLASKPTTVHHISSSLHLATTTRCAFSTSNPNPPQTSSSSTTQTEQILQSSRLTAAAQAIWSQLLRPGDTAIDATCGNGHDTFFLTSAVGPTGKVYGFDIQQAAIDATRERCDDAPQLELYKGCHSTMLEKVGGGDAKNIARVVCFNLGYLPGSDKETTTKTESTLNALSAAMECLQSGGLLSVLCYIGHDGGKTEYSAVKEVLEGLDAHLWTCSCIQLMNKPSAPVLLLAWKRTV